MSNIYGRREIASQDDARDDDRALDGKYLVDREDETERTASRPIMDDQDMDDESGYTDNSDSDGVEELSFE